jgi:hypothetical protein
MYENLTQSGSQAVIYLNDGSVCTESVAAPYILLLEQLCDGDSKICSYGTGLSSDEVEEFIAFALQEGIIVKLC